MLLTDLFKIKDNNIRKMPVAESAAIAELREEMRQQADDHKRELEAFSRTSSMSWGAPVFSMPFDGEKTGNGIGPAYDYKPWYEMLRARSWQAYLDSPIAQTVINKYTLWAIGEGLRLQAEPDMLVLKSEKFDDLDEVLFEKLVEARYNLYRSSSYSSYSDMTSLDEMAFETKKNAIIGGDVLVVRRYIDGQVKEQLIDGAHVMNPVGSGYELTYSPGDQFYRDKDGNRVSHGVVLDKTNRHLGYWVRTGLAEFEYIEARDKKNGHIRANLVYGLKYRIDNVRGLPLIAAVMEKLKKIERYDEATLQTAVSRAKVAYAIEHELGAEGTNPLQPRLANRIGLNTKGDNPIDISGQQLAKLVAATMDNDAFNLPPGAKMKALESDVATEYVPFLTTNINLVCSTLSIPPDVAMSMYNSNYSASRAAIQDWAGVLLVDRVQFYRQYYQHNYNMWLDIEIMAMRIDAPGYLDAKMKKNVVALAAFRKARFVGRPVPHIDPLKEAKAIREKLGPLGAYLPFITPEDAAETFNGADIYANMSKLKQVLEDFGKHGFTINDMEAKQDKPVKNNEEEAEVDN